MDAVALSAVATADATQRMAAQQEKFLRALTRTTSQTEGLARSMRGVANTVTGLVGGLAKLGAVTGAVGGLLGAGGLFGISRLAGAAGSGRRSALGLGVTSGAEQSAGVNLSRFVDPRGLLSNIANAQNDLGNPIFAALGIQGGRTRNAADLAPEVLVKLREQFLRNPSQQYADALGLTGIASIEDLRRLGNTPESELRGQIERYNRDRNALAVPQETQRRWQDFTRQVSLAGQTIENTFISGLVKLSNPLSHLSDSFTKAATAFLDSDTVKRGISSMADGLERFAKYVGTPQFDENVQAFLSGVERMGRVLARFAGWAERHLPVFLGGKPAPTLYAPDRVFQAIRESSAKYGIDYDAAKRLFVAEGGLDPDGTPRVSPKGAIGAGQLMPDTARQYGADPYDTLQNVDASMHFLADLRKRYGGDLRKALAAYNWGPGNLDRDIAKYGFAWDWHLPNETEKYLKYFGRPADAVTSGGLPMTPVRARDTQIVRGANQRVDIVVHNNTGGSAIITGSQVAVPQ